MDKGRIPVDYKRIQTVYPSSTLYDAFDYLLIHEVKLPRKYSMPSTSLLIRLHPESDYLAPEAYIDRRVRLNGKKSRHTDEYLTEGDLLRLGWVKLCNKVNWHPSFSLVDYLIMVIKYLEGLEE